MPLSPDKIVEKLAELEHEQWMEWSKTIASRILDETLSPYEMGERMLKQHQKWLPNWKPYAELDEATKEFDRVWARKAYAAIQEDVAAAVRELRERMQREIDAEQGELEVIDNIIDEVFRGLEEKRR